MAYKGKFVLSIVGCVALAFLVSACGGVSGDKSEESTGNNSSISAESDKPESISASADDSDILSDSTDDSNKSSDLNSSEDGSSGVPHDSDETNGSSVGNSDSDDDDWGKLSADPPTEESESGVKWSRVYY